MSLVLLQFSRQHALVAQTGIIDKRETGNPVTMLQFSVTLDIVLTSGKVPHKVAPVHKVALIAQEETDVLQLTGHLYHHLFATAVVRHLSAIHTTHPRFVSGSMTGIVHTWEQHILCILVFILGAYYKVRVLLIGSSLLLTLIYRLTLTHHRLAVVAILLQSYLRGVGWSIEQRTLTVLLTSQVITQRKDILR